MMSYANFSVLTLFFVLCKITPSCGIICYNCASNEECSRTDVCEGDYCMSAFYAPKLGKYMHLGQPKSLTGCVTGNLMKKYLVDHCERFEDELEAQNCLCKDVNFCNSVTHEEMSPVRITKLVKCQCSDCGSSRTCTGEYCTIMTDENDKIIQSCSNRSLPLMERIGDGSCMTPPISPNFVHKYLTGDHLKQEVCLCSEDNCNAKHPPKNVIGEENRRKCKMTVNYGGHALRNEKLDLGECDGDYCFKVKINDRDMKINYEASGCMSYTESRRLSEELNDEGHFNFTSSKFEIKTYFESSVIVVTDSTPVKPTGDMPLSPKVQDKESMPKNYSARNSIVSFLIMLSICFTLF